ncbi:MAG: AMP-binding protein, partial [Burkholderiales bacterium]|nr:AMP-binding protein [Burkholderiales bacterium]
MAFLPHRTAQQRPDAIALIDEEGEVSWREFNHRVNRLIRVLRAAGIGHGDRIAIFAGNSRGYFELMAAAHHAGISYVPVNWHLTAEELAYVLTDAGACALFTDARFAPVATQALALAGEAAAARLRACLGASVAPGWIGLDALIAAQTDAGEPDDQSIGGPMFYTSGTTGKPKGVVRTQEGAPPPIGSLAAFANGLTTMLELPADGVTLLAGPIYHSAQWSFAFAPMLAGSRVVMTHRFDAQQTLDLIDRHAVTNVHLVPTQFLRLLRLPQQARAAFDGGSLQRVWHGAAPCPPQAKRDMIEWWGPCLHEYYGSTEGAVVSGISSPEWLQRPGSVGRVIGAVEVRIVRDDGTDAPAGEQGTVYLRNRRPIGLKYHNDPDKTEAAHRQPGQFTTGDVGWMDDEGYLYLTDRRIDMIISGGVNIYPAE